MRLEDAHKKLAYIKGKTVGEIISRFTSKIKEYKINKGGIGQMLLLYLGLPLDSKLTDFDDGELKTNKVDKDGKSKETIFITQISSVIDELIVESPKNFYSSNLYKKIKNVLIVSVNKDDEDYNNWIFMNCYRFSYEHNSELYKQFENDYLTICAQLRDHIMCSKDNFIHTSNGKFIQVRSKDSKPYSSIYSDVFKRNISNKNHAFYFKKDFMNHVKTKL